MVTERRVAETLLPSPSAVRPLPMTVVDGVAVFDSGEDDGRPVWVLLHGLGNSAQYWSAVARELHGRARVIAVDIPGFGQSHRPDRADVWSVASLVDSGLRNQGIRTCNIAGHSLGAVLALHLAGSCSWSVERVVLVGGTLFRAARLLRHPATAMASPRLAFFLMAQFAGALVPLGGRMAHVVSATSWTRQFSLWPFVHRPTHLDPKLLEVVLGGNRGGVGVIDVLRMARRIDLEEVARTVAHPVDLLWGADDRLIDESDICLARAVFTVSREARLPHCGHWPQVENPAEVAEFFMQE